MEVYNRRPLFIAACLGMLMFGIAIAVLGAVLPMVIGKFSIGMADAGSLFLVMSLGLFAGSLVFGPVVDRYGYKGLLVVCTGLVFAGLEGIALAPAVWILSLSLMAVGFAGGAINGATNALVSDISGSRRGAGLSLLGVFFGIGALGVPFLLGSMLDSFSYEILIGMVGTLVLLPLVFFSILKFPAPKHQTGFPLKEGLSLTRDRFFLLMGLVLFIQSGIEMTISGWSATFFTEVLNIQTGKSVLVLSFYWLGLILARFAMTEVLRVVPGKKVIAGSLMLAFAGAMVIVLSMDIHVAAAGLFLTGTGFGAIFPLVYAIVGDRYTKFSGTAFGFILAIALIGGTVYPALTGWLAGSIGLRVSLLLVPASLVCSALLFLRIWKGAAR